MEVNVGEGVGWCERKLGVEVCNPKIAGLRRESFSMELWEFGMNFGRKNLIN